MRAVAGDTLIALPGQRIGLLGGSFDPPHAGHRHISEIALRRFRLDQLWWLVSPGNPLKPHGPAPLSDRIAAAKALIHDPRIRITGIEAQLGTSWTADTIAALRARWAGVRFVWLMGSDNLIQFSRWDRWRGIAAQVPIGVIARPGTRTAARMSRAARIMWNARLPEFRAGLLADAPAPAWVMINGPMTALSSSAIRAARNPAPGSRG